MATNAIVILALILQGVYSRPQNLENASSGVTISVEGTGGNRVADMIQNAVEIPVNVADMGVTGAQVGVDTVRQFIDSLFGSARTHTGSGSVQMSMTQPAWSNMVNLMQQGLSSGAGAASQGAESANQMMSGMMSLVNQPQMMTMFRQMVDNGVLTQGEGTTVNIDITKMPSEYANQLTSAFGTAKDGTVTIDLAQPASWGLISTFMQRGMSLANDGIALGLDAAKMPINIASQGIDMMKQLIPGQSANSVSISASQPASAFGSIGNSVNRLATNGAQMKLDAMKLPMDAANNGMEVAREFMTGSGMQGGSSGFTINSDGTETSGQGGSLTITRNGMSGSTNGVGDLIDVGTRLAGNGINLGLDTAGLGANMVGTGIETTRNMMNRLLGGSFSGRVRSPMFSFTTRTRGL